MAAKALGEARAKTRDEKARLIADLIENGVFAQVELQDGVPRVFIRPAYRFLTDADKHTYLATVHALAFPEGAGPGTAGEVILVDGATGEKVGAFTDAGFQ